MKVRSDFNPKNARRHLGQLRTAANYLSLVDELGGLPGGRELLDEIYTIAEKIEKLIEEAEASRFLDRKNEEI